MLLQQRQREPVQPREILPQPLLAQPGFVLAKRQIQDPVAPILYTPMAPNGAGELLHVHTQAAEVVADLDRLRPVPEAARRRQPDRLQPLPQQESGQLLGSGQLEIGPRLLTPMTRLPRHLLLRVGRVALELSVDVSDDRLMQRLLVPLQRQDIIPAPPRRSARRSPSGCPSRRW